MVKCQGKSRRRPKLSVTTVSPYTVILVPLAAYRYWFNETDLRVFDITDMTAPVSIRWNCLSDWLNTNRQLDDCAASVAAWPVSNYTFNVFPAIEHRVKLCLHLCIFAEFIMVVAIWDTFRYLCESVWMRSIARWHGDISHPCEREFLHPHPLLPRPSFYSRSILVVRLFIFVLIFPPAARLPPAALVLQILL